jgi:hypothetical protein
MIEAIAEVATIEVVTIRVARATIEAAIATDMERLRKIILARIIIRKIRK